MTSPDAPGVRTAGNGTDPQSSVRPATGSEATHSWGRAIAALMEQGPLEWDDRVDLLVTGWLFQRASPHPPGEAFLRRVFEAREDAGTAREAARRWHEALGARSPDLFERTSPPETGRWGPVRAARELGPGIWLVEGNGEGGAVLSPERNAVVLPPVRREDRQYERGVELTGPTVHFPFLAWQGDGVSALWVFGALITLRHRFPATYQALTGRPPGEGASVAVRHHRAEARRVLERIRRSGFDPRHYRRAVRRQAVAGGRDPRREVARAHPSNWMTRTEVDRLESQILDLVWSDGRP